MKTYFPLFIVLVAQLAGASEITTGLVRVAAIQCPSIMGRTVDNVRNITNLVRKAATNGAKIIVLPECAVQGYLDPENWSGWSSAEDAARPVSAVAEKVPGPATALFGRLADELNIYLCVGLIEGATNGFFNSQVLFSPEGAIVAHHRKKSLWTPGDSSWCSQGELPVQVVKTEYGNLGLMICYDFHSLPPLLAKHDADIVLYSVGWYGPNESNWFGKVFPEKAVIPYGFDVIAANWSSPTEAQEWPGRGHSSIITRKGKVLAMSRLVSGNDVVYGDLEINKRQGKLPVDSSCVNVKYQAGQIGESQYLVQASSNLAPSSAIIIYYHGAGKDEQQGMKLFPLLRGWIKANNWIYVSPRDYEIDNLLKDVFAKFGKRPVYLAGASAGGGYIYDRGSSSPSKYAGLILIGPGLRVNNEEPISFNVPTYLVYGDQDGIGTSMSKLLVKKLSDQKSPVRYLEIKGGGHNAPYPEQSWWSNALEFVTNIPFRGNE